VFRSVLLFLSALSLAACDGAPDASDGADDLLPSHRAHPEDSFELTLPSRDGTAPTGWSFAAGTLVPAEAADLLLSSSDCGARGRWVYLTGAASSCRAEEDGGVPDVESCAPFGLEIGGSAPDVALGEVFYVWHAGRDEPVALALVDRTDTPFDWYEAEDLSFEVVLAVVSE